MIFAIDKDGKRIHIDSTHVKNDYFCPVCGEKLVLKKGEIRAHHFAHQKSSECSDSWHYDMSIWHMNWQARFPLETQEIVKIKEDQKHRADVLLEDVKVVFEFQHSPMTTEEFDDRNSFYNSLGYKVIWIFDLSDQYESGAIENYRSDLFKWTRPKKTFNHFVPKEHPNIEVYFEIQGSAEENGMIRHIKEVLEAGYDLHFPDQKLYYLDHKDDKKRLIKVTWAPEDGFERFATDGFFYDESDIINLFSKKNKSTNDSVRLGDLVDHLIEMYSESHTTYYFGCPRSSTHLCGTTNIDISEDRYSEIMPCINCEFSSSDGNYNLTCKKRFIDTGLSGNTQVEIVRKTADGFISELSYVDDSGKHIIKLPTFKNPLCKSIFTLWKENNYITAVFENKRTGKFVKITSNPREQQIKYGKVYGYFSSDQYSFNGKSCELYWCEKPEWVCVWYKR